MKPSDVLRQLSISGLRPPKIVTFAITGACNLTCRHCWVSAGEQSSPDHVPVLALRPVVAECAALGCNGIRITGGEPLCHPDWPEIMLLSRTLGFSTIILQTNAMLIGEAECVFLSGLDFPGLSIQISLDGVSSRSHDQVRGEGAFNSALQGIARLVQYGLGHRISIFMTEMRHNLHEIPELLAFVDHRGLGSFSSGALVGCGRASGTLSEVLPPEPEQYLKLLERYDHDARFRELYGRFGTVAALEWRTSDAARKDCCTFVENPYLTPSGRLYPCLLCHADEYSVTGVFEKGLAAALAEGLPLWSELLRISLRRSEDCDECRNCRVKASCGAGCMGRAWGSFGDLVAADDRCRVRQAVRRYADDLIG